MSRVRHREGIHWAVIFIIWTAASLGCKYRCESHQYIDEADWENCRIRMRGPRESSEEVQHLTMTRIKGTHTER